jgi:hypothetical protein
MPSTISAGTTAGTAIAVAGDTTGNLAFQTNGTTTAMTIDTSQNVGIGTTSPISNGGYGGLSLNGTSGALFSLMTNGTESGRIASLGDETSVQCKASTGFISFVQGVSGGTERMRIDSSGNVIFGATSTTAPSLNYRTSSDGGFFTKNANTTGATTAYDFLINGIRVGAITTAGSNTTYSTSSDYRLKEQVTPMTGALNVVQALKPVTYKWKIDGSNGQGFIAHELAEICPDAVIGEKDALDEDGNIKPQGIDTSFLVATLTAAIQELNAKVEAQALEIQTLKNTPAENT